MINKIIKELNKEKGGFFDLDLVKKCNSPEHEPPTHIYIPYGKGYKHVCPQCGQTQDIIPPQISF